MVIILDLTSRLKYPVDVLHALELNEGSSLRWKLGGVCLCFHILDGSRVFLFFLLTNEAREEVFTGACPQNALLLRDV